MGTRGVGERIGIGRTSNVFAYGSDSVVKIPHADVPSDWPVFEADIARSIYGAGLPVPEVRDVIPVDGRTAVVFERVHGPSMWNRMVDQPAEIDSLVRELATIQRALMGSTIPAGVPDFVDRLVRRLSVAPGLDEQDRSEAVQLSNALPRGAALLHGDLHPGNILMSESGPVVIDWFDASIGHPIADIVRSSILMRPGSGPAPGHLPDATPEILDRLHRGYVAEFAAELHESADRLAVWQGVVAAGRLAEGAEVNEEWLIQLWSVRAEPTPPVLAVPSRSPGRLTE